MKKRATTEDRMLSLAQALYKVNDEKKLVIDIPGYNEYDHEGPFSKNINPHEFKVGEVLYYDDNPILALGHNWRRIKITGVRAGIVFFIYTKFPKKEHWLPIDCIAIAFGKLMPLKYIVDKKIFPKEYYEFKSKCPYTKIVYK